MGKLYEFYAPGFFKHICIMVIDSFSKDATPVEWIRVKNSGEWFALDQGERAILGRLSDALSNFLALPHATQIELTDNCFDAVVSTFVARRNGVHASYEKLEDWSIDEWRVWCESMLKSATQK
jgi:hypothetical protein